jgi:translation initiation factor 2B subunit (eIF-2B alpha/beta/delta family)
MVKLSAEKKREIFNKILSDIKTVRIQGARNIAKKALYAYSLMPTKISKKKLISARPTEPMLKNVLDKYNDNSYQKLLSHFEEAQKRINEYVFKIINNGDRIFTHCHSTNVVRALIYAKSRGKKFQVYNTETRPLMQGRRTSRELARAGIKTTQFVDSTLASVLEKENKKDKIFTNKVFLGADALLEKGIINKVGSHLISEVAFYNKIPVYIISDSWKFTKSRVSIEERNLNEVWDKAPKNVKIKNPAFTFVPKRYITKIVTEWGALKYDDFLHNVFKLK